MFVEIQYPAQHALLNQNVSIKEKHGTNINNNVVIGGINKICSQTFVTLKSKRALACFPYTHHFVLLPLNKHSGASRAN